MGRLSVNREVVMSLSLILFCSGSGLGCGRDGGSHSGSGGGSVRSSSLELLGLTGKTRWRGSELMSAYGMSVWFSSDGDKASLEGVDDTSPSLALCKHRESNQVW